MLEIFKPHPRPALSVSFADGLQQWLACTPATGYTWRALTADEARLILETWDLTLEPTPRHGWLSSLVWGALPVQRDTHLILTPHQFAKLCGVALTAYWPRVCQYCDDIGAPAHVHGFTPGDPRGGLHAT